MEIGGKVDRVLAAQQGGAGVSQMGMGMQPQMQMGGQMGQMGMGQMGMQPQQMWQQQQAQQMGMWQQQQQQQQQQGGGGVDPDGILQQVTALVAENKSTAGALEQAKEQLAKLTARVAELGDKNSDLVVEKSALMEKVGSARSERARVLLRRRRATGA
jgi:hypothetical protein